MKTITFILLLLIYFPGKLLKAQPIFDPQLIMEKEIVFGGLGDNIFSALTASDGYVIAGHQLLHDSGTWKSFSRVQKFDSNDELVWEYTGPESSSATWQSLAPAPDGGVFLGEGWDIAFVSKLDSQGNVVWLKNLGTTAWPVLVANNNYLVVVLSTYAVCPVLILDLDGNEINSWDVVLDMSYAAILDNNYLYILGDNPGGVLTNVHSEIIKTDLSGNIAWSDTLMDVHGLRGAIDTNGNLYVSGFYFPNNLSWYRTVKYDLDGNRLWERLWDGDPTGSYATANWLNSLIAHPNGGCVAVGALTKIGSNDPNAIEGGSIAYDPNGNVYFKIRYDYRPEWYRSDFTASLFDQDNILVIFGSTWNLIPDTAQALFLTKWDNVSDVDDENNEIGPGSTPYTFSLSQNYPNPFNPTTRIKYAISSRQYASLKVYDVIGREVATLVNEEKPPGQYEVELNATGLPSGVYFYRLKAGSFIQTRKMVLLQ